MINREHWVSETLPPIAAYVALDIALTFVFIAISPASVDIGAIRPVVTIPAKVVELIFIGLALGLIGSLSFRKIDLNLLTLSVAFVLLLDVDHLPAAFGYDEPIRPAHTIVFLLVLLLVLSFTIRKQPEVELLAIAAFLGHIAGDTGVFAVLAPFSFNYASLDPYRVPLAAGAVAFALLAGYVKHRRYEASSGLVLKGVLVNETKSQTNN